MGAHSWPSLLPPAVLTPPLRPLVTARPARPRLGTIPDHPTPPPPPGLLCCYLHCSSWTSTPCVSPSSCKSLRGECEPCSCHISTDYEHMQARAGVGRRNVRRGGCVRKHAKSGRTATPKEGRAERAVALAPGDPDGRARSFAARTRGDVSMCTGREHAGQGGARVPN